MYYRHLTEGCFAERIGTGGVSAADFDDSHAADDAEQQRIRQTSEPEMVAVLALPEKTDDIAAIHDASERLSSGFTNILVVGTGGSSLGARTLCSLAPNTTPKLHFLENVDPSELDPFFDQLDPALTSALFVSKSGGTLETLAVSMVVMNWLREGCGEAALGRQTMAIIEQNDNPLARLCDRYGIPVMPHDPHIGGRYSIFSAVGMLPATLAGLDASAIRGGATSVLTSGAPVHAAALAAAVALAVAAEKQHASSVLMPYRDQLSTLALWYRQLWAEGLSKDGKGTTPIQASGAVDQHSQLQLYLDGPNDKLISLVTCPAMGTGTTIPGNLAQEAGQPAVETGKKLAKAHLTEKLGYAA